MRLPAGLAEHVRELRSLLQEMLEELRRIRVALLELLERRGG